VTVDNNLPFLHLEDSPVSPKPSPLDHSLDRLFDSSQDLSIERIPRKKGPSMHQRIRSLLSTPSNASTSPRVSITEAPASFRPPSPSPSTTTVDSRLSRSNAYRSLGRALIGKGPKSPGLPSSHSSSAELSFAERIVLETLVPSFSPIPSIAPAVRPRSKSYKIEDVLTAAAAAAATGGEHSVSFSDSFEKESGTKTVKKSTIRKKMSMGVLQFFHDDSKSTTPSSTPAPRSPTTTPDTTSSTTSKPLKEKRRPKALSITSSNHIAVNNNNNGSPSLVKKMSFLAIGPSRSAHLLPPSPLNLASTTPPVSPRPILSSRSR